MNTLKERSILYIIPMILLLILSFLLYVYNMPYLLVGGWIFKHNIFLCVGVDTLVYGIPILCALKFGQIKIGKILGILSLISIPLNIIVGIIIQNECSQLGCIFIFAAPI